MISEGLGQERRYKIVEMQIDAIFNPQILSDCKSFISKSKQLSSAWNSNNHWPYECYLTVSKTAQLLANNKTQINARDICDYLATRRNKIAQAYCETDSWFFGRLRPESKEAWTTLIPARYGDFLETLEKKLQQLMAQQSNSQFIISFKGITIYYGSTQYSTLLSTSENRIIIFHAPYASIDKAYEHIEPLFQTIISAPKPTTEAEFRMLIENIGRIAWHHFHAMPSVRGNAAITEMLIRTLMKIHQIKLPLYNQLVICDLLAIFEPDPEAFSKEFYTYFDWEKKLEDRFVATQTKKLSQASLLKNIESCFQQFNIEDSFVAFNYLLKNYPEITKAEATPAFDPITLKPNLTPWQQTRIQLADIMIKKLQERLKELDRSESMRLLQTAKNQRIFFLNKYQKIIDDLAVQIASARSTLR